MSTALLRRRGVARVSGVLGVCALVSTGVVISSTAASAEEETVTGSLQTFAAEAFAPQADELPTGLVEAIQRDLGISAEEYLANAAAAKVAADVSAELVDAGVNVNATVIDGQDVTLYVEAEADVAAAEAVGAKVEIGEPEQHDYSDYDFEPKIDHKGGYGFFTQASPDGSGYRCSVGFSGYTPDGADRYLTAGHCGLDGETYEQLAGPVSHLPLDAPIGPPQDPPPPLNVGDEIGDLTDGSFHFGPDFDNYDAGLVDITNPDYTGVPQVAGWGGGEGAPDENSVTVYGTIDAVQGAEACKSGSTSGWTCGTIQTPEQSVTFGTGETVTGFIFDACMLGGDSGGSIVVGNYALGVNSGSDFGPDCNTGSFGIGFAVSGGQYNALDVLGDQWELNVAVNAPAVSTPEDGGETGQSVTFEGTVEGGTADHRVSVSVDGGDAVEGDVAADGSFSVPLEGDLEPGEHSYAVQAFYGNHSQSEVTEGSWTVTEAPPVEELAVDSPSEGQTTGNARPEFSGTGQPGATVALTVGDAEFGSAEVGEDGSWAIAPESDLPVGVRFDAVVTQTFEEDTQKVTVAGLGIEAADVTITAPEDGSSVAGDTNFEGTSFGGATVGLLLEQAAADAAGDDAQPRLGLRAEGDDDVEEWAGEFEIDDAGNWTFDPAEDLPEGEYTITAQATLEGGDPELADSEAVATFTVANGGGDDDGDDDLPDTGSSGTTWMIVGGVALLLAGGAAVAVRARRNAGSTTA
ncbi:S1 family peptidase [Jiangella alkaliphila]|uniref:LPXTG-motif cell wall anchor domain-containing protein n=1 Tax=Jiangella alkaliphila TaxID=419479 RepID=A0A1H2JJJ6_9ACTN|nr:S1 family peptidase [Jiangella alkaliphila]SDU56318.1 LPXTG-motif cell wall anchor domain-containing protein [Jiangella alkaliphila]